MDRKKYTRYSMITTIAVGFAVGLSASRGDSTIAIAAVIIGMVLLSVLKRRVKEVIEDERIYRISEKASRRTVQVVGITMAVIGLVSIGLSKSGYSEIAQFGYTLAFFASALLLVYIIFYGYYSKKYGA